MDLLRRILGLTSKAVSEGEQVSITQDVDTELSQPQAPIIQAPAPSEDVSASPETITSHELAEAAVIDVEAFVGTRPLPPLETIIPTPGQRLRFGQRSDVGMVRGNNQDAVFGMFASGTSAEDTPDFGLFTVADGMGGHQEGERAAAITTHIIAQYVLQEIFVALLSQKMNDPDRPSITDVLREAVQAANEAVTEQIPEGGTTVTTTVILGDLAYIAHVGDSRAYLIADDRIEQITRDHSLVQRLIELDQLTPEEAAEHPQRNVLYRAIGQNETLDVDAITRRLSPLSQMLLCSDGVWNMISEEALLEIVLAHKDPQAACNQIVQLANDRGGPDNITAVLVRMPG